MQGNNINQLQSNLSIHQPQGNSQYEHEKQYNQQQLQSLKEQLILLYQSLQLNKLFTKIQDHHYWAKFHAFYQIRTLLNTHKDVNLNRDYKKQIIPYQQTYHLNKSLRSIFVLLSQYQTQLKQYTIQKIKSYLNEKIQKDQLKASFFTHYFIKPTYLKLSLAFINIKQYTNFTKNTKHYISSNKILTERENSKIKEDEKLMKFQKQSRKFRLKQLTIILRNFINIKYLKPGFSQIRLISQEQVIKCKKRGVIDKVSQNIEHQSITIKDARFIKKKALAHKVIQDVSTKRNYIDVNSPSLQKGIMLNDYELKSMKRRVFESAYMLGSLVDRKLMQIYQQSFGVIVQFKNPLRKQKELLLQQKQSQINEQLQGYVQQEQLRTNNRQAQDNEAVIMRNVMKTMCYVSLRMSRKQSNKLLRQRKQTSMRVMLSVLSKSMIRTQLSAGFYAIKQHIIAVNVLILERIDYLAQVKRQFMDYYQNSIIQQE